MEEGGFWAIWIWFGDEEEEEDEGTGVVVAGEGLSRESFLSAKDSADIAGV